MQNQMDNELLNGIILSYNKILSELREIKQELKNVNMKPVKASKLGQFHQEKPSIESRIATSQPRTNNRTRKVSHAKPNLICPRQEEVPSFSNDIKRKPSSQPPNRSQASKNGKSQKDNETKSLTATQQCIEKKVGKSKPTKTSNGLTSRIQKQCNSEQEQKRDIFKELESEWI